MALVVPSKAVRVHNFHKNTLEALQEIMQSAGLHSPQDLSTKHIMRRVTETHTQHLSELIDNVAPGALLLADVSQLPDVYRDWPTASASSFSLRGA
jgi:hypothetical protein